MFPSHTALHKKNIYIWSFWPRLLSPRVLLPNKICNVFCVFGSEGSFPPLAIVTLYVFLHDLEIMGTCFPTISHRYWTTLSDGIGQLLRSFWMHGKLSQNDDYGAPTRYNGRKCQRDPRTTKKTCIRKLIFNARLTKKLKRLVGNGDEWMEIWEIAKPASELNTGIERCRFRR